MSEYLFVEKPFLDHLRALGWEVIDQGCGGILRRGCLDHEAAKLHEAPRSAKPTKAGRRHAGPYVVLSFAVASRHPARIGTRSVLRNADASCSPAPRAVCSVTFFVAFVFQTHRADAKP